jgi:hypothetical protein
MNKIMIYQENQQPIVLFDDEEYDETSLRDNLSFLFTASKIVKLSTKTKTGESMVILRPSKITSISVKKIKEEENESIGLFTDDEEETEKENKTEINVETTVKPEKDIDIITD